MSTHFTEIQAWMARRRAEKGSGPTTVQNFGTGTLINGTRFRGLLDDTVSTAKWFRHGVHMVEVDPGQQNLQIENWEAVRWQHIPDGSEGDPNFDATVEPALREVSIDTKHHVLEMQIGKRAQRKAKAWLNADLQRQRELGFATAFGNNMARTMVRGDTTSADPSLNAYNGIYVNAQAQGRTLNLASNVGGVMVAQAFTPEVFWEALKLLPEGLRSQMLRWYANDLLWIEWARFLSNTDTNERLRDQIAEDALINGIIKGPINRPGLSIPDWPADDGPSADPTAVVDDGDGTMTVRVASILPDATDHSGRRVRVTLDSTGAYEDLRVTRSGGQNIVETAGALGQAVISAVAADYTVKVIDETSIVLANPFGILGLIENEVEVYRTFDERGLNHGTIAHTWTDQRLLRPDAVVFVNGIYLPQRV